MRPTRPLPRLLAAALLCAGIAGPAAAFDPAAMSAEERAAFNAAVRSYLLENPEVLLEAIEILNAREAAAQAAADERLVAENAAELFEDGHSWVGGNPDGDVTIVEFLDYRCGVCRRAHPEVWGLVRGDGNIRYVVKEFPILGPDSEASARFAVATLRVAGPEAYERVHNALIEMRPPASEANLRRLAGELGLDGGAILAAMSDPEVTRILEANRALGIRLKVSGTPTFVIGGRMVRGLLPAADLERIVEEERAERG